MSIKIVKKLWMLIIVFVIIDTISIPVYAKDSVSCSGNFYTSPTKKNEQVRYITVVKDPVWTDLETVAGQPTKGTYLKKGDSLYYGKIHSAKQSGYYLIKAKKEVEVTVVFKQYRRRNGINPYSDTGKWGAWGKAKVSSKKYKTIRTYSKLVKQ